MKTEKRKDVKIGFGMLDNDELVIRADNGITIILNRQDIERLKKVI